MMNDSITEDLLFVLDTLVVEYLSDGYFRIIGNIPHWFKQFYPEANSYRDRLFLEEKFPFLENFLIDAKYFWAENHLELLKSGLWTEVDASGNEYYLEASAVILKNRKILLISLGEIAIYEEKQFLIQKYRENSLSYYKLVKEIEKKEILIHCIVHDLAGQLTAIKCCFDLLAFQNLTPKGMQFLEVGKSQCHKQEMLIREILDAFSAEVESLQDFTLDPEEAPDALTCSQEVVNALSPTCVINKVNLQLEPGIDASANWQVVGERVRFDRVLSNLIENAIRHSPPESTVTVGLKQDDKFILITVNDQGPGVPEHLSNTLFQKFSQGKVKAGRVGLGLYFCRITVERWGGEIGYSLPAEGGSQFWFRLLKLNEK